MEKNYISKGHSICVLKTYSECPLFFYMRQVYSGCRMSDFFIREIYGFPFTVNLNGLCVHSPLLGMPIRPLASISLGYLRFFVSIFSRPSFNLDPSKCLGMLNALGH